MSRDVLDLIDPPPHPTPEDTMTDSVYRWFDHNGNIIEAPAAEGRPTAYRGDDQRTHWMFGEPSSTPSWRAMTLCGRRAWEIPGRGEVDCPKCIQTLENTDDQS